ncbi:MAG: hypothetical protein JRF37_00480 [Deltaproteobacteria bacterium]|nr:hypothetical protein [Deltaproteobacteria bacterium]
MIRKISLVLVAAGVLGFFVGSVIENEMVYTLSGCVAVWSGLIMSIQGRMAQNGKRS